ncbi:enolase C-terminal domain-like protein [Daldinia sp. FL1419]|nr:enolase C-terminal domain-like protein [Daldinia sp. FL1419]
MACRLTVLLCSYQSILKPSTDLVGHGIAFTNGRGNDFCVVAARHIADRLVGKTLGELTVNMGQTWRYLVSDSQLRWIGPEKSVIYLGLSACVNALWDLRGCDLNKQLWKLVSDFTREEFVSRIDSRYTLTRRMSKFKIKVGGDVEEDRRCLQIASDTIEVMQKFGEFKPLFIEEPTSPDDILGHAAIRESLTPYGVDVATGYHCQNRIQCVPIVPSSGGIGLDEYTQHHALLNYTTVSGEKIETRNGYFVTLREVGYSVEYKLEPIEKYQFLSGSFWNT